MDARILTIVAQLAPQERIAFAQSQGVPPQILQQLERAAVESGLTLNGGSVFEGGPAGDDDDDDDAGAGVPAAVSLSDILEDAKQKAMSWGTAGAFFLAIPVILYVMKERRGMTWSELFQSAARLPFSD